MKVWGIGTGRCGTVTLAKVRGGIHEPKPWIHKEAARYYCGERGDELLNSLRHKLAARLRLKEELIVDSKQSLIIPFIMEIDPGAEFVWLVREPRASMKSFSAWEFYSREPSEDFGYELDQWRARPPGGFPSNWSLLMKRLWFWEEINKVIARDLELTGAPFKLKLTHQLGPVVHNAVATKSWLFSKRDVVYDRGEKAFMRRKVQPLWNAIRSCKENGVGNSDLWKRLRSLPREGKA